METQNHANKTALSDELAEAKAVLDKWNMFELADRLLALRDRKKELEDQVKETNRQIEETEQQLISLMQQNDLQNFKRNGKLFYQTVKTWASPKAEAKEKVYAWLKENGFADMVKETVNAQSFSSLINEFIENDGEVPEDLAELINVTEKVSIGVRKG